MVLSMISLISVSKLMVWLFNSKKLEKKHDVFKCIVNISEDEVQVNDEYFNSSKAYSSSASTQRYFICIAKL